MCKKKLLIVVIIIACGLVMFLGKKSNAEEWQITRLHKILASGTGWLNVERGLTEEDLKGRIILLDFWTFCCINCIHVIPDLHYLENKFADKLTVIGVHSAKFANEKDKDNIRNAVLRYDIEHPVVNDADFAIWQSFGIRAWPTFVLIGPDGKINEIYSGEGNRNAVEDDIEDLLEEYGDSINTSALPIDLEKNKAAPTVLKYPGKIEYTDNYDGAPALFISDSSNDRVLGTRLDGRIFIEIGSGEQGFKDGDFTSAQLNTPQGILYDNENDVLYIADTNNHSIRKADLKSGKVETVAGTGEQGYNRAARNDDAMKTKLASPWDLEFYPDKNHIAIAMAGTHQLWQYSISDKTVSVIAGNGRESIDDGSLPFNSLSQPSGLSALGDKLYFVDSETSSLRVFEDGEITTLIGTGLFDFGFVDGQQGDALMQHSIGVFADKSGVYIADSYNHSIRRYDPESGILSTIFGNGKTGELNEPNDVILTGGKLFVADTNNNQVKIIDVATKKISSLDVMPQEKEGDLKISDILPNLKQISQQDIVSGKDIKISIRLPDGYKLNEIAPSWLAAFNADNGKLINKFGYEELKKGSITLFQLDAGHKYRLQGTLYYCEDKTGSICLVQSYDSVLTGSESGISTINIEVTK